jgi:hypothetical protein
VKTLLTIWYFFLALTARAQDHFDNLHGNRLIVANAMIYSEDSSHHPVKPRLHGALSATGIASNANGIKSYTFSNNFKGSIVTRDVTINLTGSYVYGETANILSNNDFTTSLDANVYEHPSKLYYWVLADYTSSHSLLINRQEQAGAGAGYNLIDKKKATLNVSDGLLYENGDLYDSLYGGPNGSVYQRDIYSTIRNSVRVLGHWVVWNKVSLDATWYYQNALSNSADYIMKVNAAASVKLRSWLSFTTSYAFNRFTRTRTENSLLTFGLTLSH